MELDNQRYTKVKRILNPFYKNENYKLNYLMENDELLIFASINECNEIPEEVLQQVASALDGAYKCSTLVNQEYRYLFNLNPCGK